MKDLFLTIADLSFTASMVILFVLIARLFLKKAPKIFSYLLWFIVFFRLLFPFSIEAPFSFMLVRDKVFSSQKASYQEIVKKTQEENLIFMEEKPSIEQSPAGGPESFSKLPQNKTGKEGVSSINLAASVWIGGMVLLLIWNGLSTYRFAQKLKRAAKELINEEIYRIKGLETAFIFGLLKPKIYLPSGLKSVEELYILSHERVHLSRGDHIIKFLAFFISCIHWFNPLVWLSYYLMTRDMELSCDEAVIRRWGFSVKKKYSSSLLALACQDRVFHGSAIAFGENNVRARVKNILSYRKPKKSMSIGLLVFVLAFSLGCITDVPSISFRDPILKENVVYKNYKEGAEAYMEAIQDKQNFEIIHSKLDTFRKLNTFESILDTPVELWQLKFRLKPKSMEEAEKNLVDFAQDKGWITKLYSDKSLNTFLMFTKKGDKLYYLGNLNDMYIDYSQSSILDQEHGIRTVLEELKLKPKVSFEGKYFMAEFQFPSGDVAKLLLSKPIKQDDSGIWVVERWIDQYGQVHRELMAEEDRTSLDYFKLVQEQVDKGKESWRLDPEQVALNYIQNSLGLVELNERSIEISQIQSLDKFYQLPLTIFRAYYLGMEEKEDNHLADILNVDNVEFLGDSDGKRLEQLGIDPNKLDNGYYINNPYSAPNGIFLKEDTIYKIARPEDIAGPRKIVSKEEFREDMEAKKKNYPPLLELKMSEGKAIEITEVYLP